MSIKKVASLSTIREIDCKDAINFVLNIDHKIWRGETQKRKNNFPVFNHTEHIIFRLWNEAYLDPGIFEEYPLWKFAQNIFFPMIEDACQVYNYKNPVFPVIMLAKLKAHSEIGAHRDKGRRFEVTHKIHIPLVTHPDVLFYVNEESFHLPTGYAYEVNNTEVHRVENNSSTDRIHLIFECYPNQ